MAPNFVKEKTIQLAESLLNKLKGSLEDKDDNPPQPPPKPSTNPASNQNPFPTFVNLSLSDPPANSTPDWNRPFIGGFNPVVNSHPSTSTPNLSRPPLAMPTAIAPQSLTMQMALRPPDVPFIRPQSNPVPFTVSAPSFVPGRPTGKPASVPVTPIKNSKSDSASSASDVGSPAKKTDQERCAGVTKAGKRCTRMVKARPTLESIDSDDSEQGIPRFCHQHAKELMTPSGYYSRKNGEWVKFEDWIPSYLQADTQVSLRVEMERARSQSDVPGYIYTFEIREPQEGDTIKLKVGRAVNLVKRIDQWGKQCGSKEQVLRGFYPGSVEPDDTSLMRGRVIAGEKGPWCHRLERLIHIELADLVSSCIYLAPSWPSVKVDASSSTSESKSNDSKNAPTACPDCGSMHKEIFEFKRWKRGKYKGREWDQLVKPVVERWGKFVELYV